MTERKEETKVEIAIRDAAGDKVELLRNFPFFFFPMKNLPLK